MKTNASMDETRSEYQEKKNPETLNQESKTVNYLLTNETFQLLRNAQAEIQNQTEIIPKLRKMINAILTEERIEEYTLKFIEKFKNS